MVTIAVVGLSALGRGVPLNLSGEAVAAVRGSHYEKVQDAPPPGQEPTHVTLVVLPKGTAVEELADLGMSPGLLSAGLGSVPAEQTYLDVTQGNRVFDSLYSPEKLPAMGARGCSPSWWRAVRERADSAPADIVPGLLASSLESAGVGVRVGGGASCTFSSGASRRQQPHSPPERLSGTPYPHFPPTFEARKSTLDTLPSLVRSLRGDDLLIAIERPPPPGDEALAIGVAGAGFDGDLTSDSTRTDGYVLTTDVAPTILARLGIVVPAAMSGQPIRVTGHVDAAAVEALGERMGAISARRGPVIGLSLLVWLLALGLATAISRGAAARFGVELMALSVVYLPLVLLIASIARPSEGVELLLAMALSPLLGGLTMRWLDGYRPLAVASGVVVVAYALDILAGSPFTSLSLLGPNPGLGVRFYGIGNELEALLAVLVLGGTGAALSGYFPKLERRRVALGFLGAGLLAAVVFAAGRFGADVGAAIVLPIGAAAAAAKVVATPRRHATVAIFTTLFLVLGFIAVIDLVTGANAHLTRSVLDAGGFDDLGDVAQRRLRLSAHSFARPVLLAFMPLVLAAAVLALWKRDMLRDWLRGAPALAAGLLGALAATVAGTLANDSGALVLEIGSAYLLAFLGFAWAEGTGRSSTLRAS